MIDSDAIEIVYSSIAENKDFHNKSVDSDNPYLYCLLSMPSAKVRTLSVFKSHKINNTLERQVSRRVYYYFNIKPIY